MSFPNQKLTELEGKLSLTLNENVALRKTITEMETAYFNLESEYSKIKSLYSGIASREGTLKLLEMKLNEKEDLITKLQHDLELQNKKHEKYKLEYDLQYEKEINQAKYVHENNIAKIENANKIEKLCKSLYEVNIKYEQTIKTFEEEEKKRMQEREVEHEKQMSDMKKKMLDYIKNGQKKGNAFNSKQADLNAKLTLLHNNQILTELEFQSLQIEDLLKQREHLDHIILELKSDIKVHKEVEKVLSEKNKKYTNMIKILSNKIDNLLKSKPHKTSVNNTLTNSVNTLDENEKLPTPLHLHLTHKKSASCTSLLPSSQFDNFNFNPRNTNAFSKGNRFVQVYHQLISKTKEVENYKDKYETLKDKFDSLQITYANIIQHLEKVLENMYNSNEKMFSNIKEMYVNINDFTSCDFDKLSQEQKYSAIVMIIKCLLPIVGKEVLDNGNGFTLYSGKANRNINMIKTKFYFGNKEESTKTFTSFGFGETKSTCNFNMTNGGKQWGYSTGYKNIKSNKTIPTFKHQRLSKSQYSEQESNYHSNIISNHNNNNDLCINANKTNNSNLGFGNNTYTQNVMLKPLNNNNDNNNNKTPFKTYSLLKIKS